MSPVRPRIYLDNAATSWPKPESVYDAIDRYQRECGVAAGRGSYRDAEEVERTIAQARLSIAKLIGAKSSNHVVFTLNCTDALNLALHGLLRAGDHVVTTAAEHNSILRPLAYLSRHRDVSVTSIPVDTDGLVDIQQLASYIKSETRLIAMTHASKGASRAGSQHRATARMLITNALGCPGLGHRVTFWSPVAHSPFRRHRS